MALLRRAVAKEWYLDDALAGPLRVKRLYGQCHSRFSERCCCVNDLLLPLCFAFDHFLVLSFSPLDSITN